MFIGVYTETVGDDVYTEIVGVIDDVYVEVVGVDVYREIVDAPREHSA
jgi:hypothetical protein